MRGPSRKRRVTDREAGRKSARTSMERTRGIFRRPLVWILLVIIGAIALSSLFTGKPSYVKVNTSDVLTQINSTGGIKKITIKDKEQALDIELAQKVRVYKEAIQPSGSTQGELTDRIQAQYPIESGDEILNQIEQAKAANRVETFTT